MIIFFNADIVEGGRTCRQRRDVTARSLEPRARPGVFTAVHQCERHREPRRMALSADRSPFTDLTRQSDAWGVYREAGDDYIIMKMNPERAVFRC